MTERKTKGRFTIQFNLADPQQASASDMLERQGRHKAQFLTNAIREYAGEGPSQAKSHIMSDLEREVRKLVDQYLLANHLHHNQE